MASNPQSAFAWHARERHCAACPSGGGVARELAARARRKALVLIGSRTIEGHCAGERPLSFIARPWCDVLDVAFNSQSAFAWHTRERHCAACLSGGGAAREPAARTRRAALVVTSSNTAYGDCTGGRPLSFGARPWCDVPAMASNTRPAFAPQTRARHYAACLSGGGKAH